MKKTLELLLGPLQEFQVLANTVRYLKLGDYDDYKFIYIVELQQKAKEYALKRNITLGSCILLQGARCILDNLDTGESKMFTADTEADAVFKALEYIRKGKR